MANNYCVCCGDEVPEGRQVCSICEVEKLRSGGDLNAASKPGTYTVNDERELIGKLEIGVEFKKCSECEYKLRCTDEEKRAIHALKVIKEICGKYPTCADCPYHDLCDDCFAYDRPEKWKISE